MRCSWTMKHFPEVFRLRSISNFLFFFLLSLMIKRNRLYMWDWSEDNLSLIRHLFFNNTDFLCCRWKLHCDQSLMYLQLEPSKFVKKMKATSCQCSAKMLMIFTLQNQAFLDKKLAKLKCLIAMKVTKAKFAFGLLDLEANCKFKRMSRSWNFFKS